MKRRLTAIRAEIADIIHGKFSSEDGSRLISPYGVEIRRVALVGFVIDRYTSDGYSSITIDDGSGAIRVKGWGTDATALSKVELKSLILLIGRVKEYETELYVVPEIIRSIFDHNILTLHKLERIRTILEQGGAHSSGIVENAFEEPELESTTIISESSDTLMSTFKKTSLPLQERTEQKQTVAGGGTLRNKLLEFMRTKARPVSIDELLDFTEGQGFDKNDVMLKILDLLEEGVIREDNIGTYELS